MTKNTNLADKLPAFSAGHHTGLFGTVIISGQSQNREMMPQSSLPSLDQQFYRDEHLFVHLRHQVVMLDGETVPLTRMQYRLLALLVEHAGELVIRPILLMQIWGDAPELSPDQVDVHIRGLRRKLGAYADRYIEKVIGVGYRFRPFLPRD